MARRTSEGSVITGTLKQIDRRVRLNGFIDHLSIAVCTLLGILVVIRIGGILVPIDPPSSAAIAGVAAVLFAAFALSTQLRGARLARAAAFADSRGNLYDELKSAYWFLREQRESPWIDEQVSRAADTARGLDTKRLVPTAVPQRLWIALALFAIFLVLPLLTAGEPLFAFSGPDYDPALLTSQEEEQFEEIRDLMELAEELQAEGLEDPLSEEARERLEEALRQLEAQELTMEELLREMREAQNALEEGNLDMQAMQEALEEIAADLAGSEEMADLAEALIDRELMEAAELMRALAEQLSQMQGDQAQELMERLQQASQADQPSIQELMDALEAAAEALSDEQMQEAMQAMQQAAEALEDMAQRMDAQELMNQAAQQMAALQEQMGQRPMPAPMQMDPSQQMMQQASAEEGGEAQSAAALPSDEVQKQSGGGESGDPSDQEGGPAGHATSDPMGGELKLGAPTTLEVQLEMELLQKPEEPEEETDPEDIFQEASRQENSVLEYRSVRGRSSYAEGAALNVERIPWRYRNLVKKYFLAIRPRESK